MFTIKNYFEKLWMFLLFAGNKNKKTRDEICKRSAQTTMGFDEKTKLLLWKCPKTRLIVLSRLGLCIFATPTWISFFARVLSFGAPPFLSLSLAAMEDQLDIAEKKVSLRFFLYVALVLSASAALPRQSDAVNPCEFIWVSLASRLS